MLPNAHGTAAIESAFLDHECEAGAVERYVGNDPHPSKARTEHERESRAISIATDLISLFESRIGLIATTNGFLDTGRIFCLQSRYLLFPLLPKIFTPVRF